jgi:hypothetical protein
MAFQEQAAQVENLISQHEALANVDMVKLITQRNALTPLYRLPIEILALIMEQLQLIQSNNDFHSTFKSKHASTDDSFRPGGFDSEFHAFCDDLYWHEMKAIVFVCKRFWEAAQSYPRLWAIVRIPGSYRRSWGFARAAGRSLELQCEPSQDTESYSEIREARKVMDRAHAILLTAAEQIQLNHGMEIFTDDIDSVQREDPAPLLTILKLHVRHINRYSDTFDGGLSWVWAQLTDLDLTGLVLLAGTWPSKAWPQLRRFRLERVSVEPDFFMKMLYLMPKLETLSLMDLYGYDPGDLMDDALIESTAMRMFDDEDTDTSGFLGKLKHLHIQDNPQIICSLLRTFARAIMPSQSVALRIVGFRNDNVGPKSSGDEDGNEDQILNLVRYVLRGSRWSPIWQQQLGRIEASTPSTEIQGTLIWTLGQYTRWNAKFVAVGNEGIESRLETHFLPQHATAYAEHGLVFRELKVIDPRSHKSHVHLLQERIPELDKLVKLYARDIDTIWVSESTARSRRLAQWLEDRVGIGHPTQMCTYVENQRDDTEKD